MSDLDSIDRKLVEMLQANDQSSLGDLGKVVGLAPSSVKERIKRLTTHGVIEGFHARVSPQALSLDLLAYVFVGWSDRGVEPQFLAKVAEEPTVLECHHVTGSWNYLLKVRVRNTRMLEAFLGRVVKGVDGIQRTESLIMLSSTKETMMLPSELPDWAQ